MPEEAQTTKEEKKLVPYKGIGGKEWEIEEELYNSINGRVSAEKNTVKERYEKQLADREAELENIKKETDKLRRASMTDKQQQEEDQKKREEEYLRAQQERDQYLRKFQEKTVSTSLYDTLSKYSVWNPRQVEKLIKTEAQPKVDNDDNVIFNYNGKELSTEEMVKTFLNDPLNANLLKPTLSSGGGTQKSGITTTTLTKEKLKGMSPKEINDNWDAVQEILKGK